MFEKKILLSFSFLILFCVQTFANQPRIVTCYNDDSLDVINQDELRPPIWGGPVVIPNPQDCIDAPAVFINEYGYVQIGQEFVYHNSWDRAVEAKTSPEGFVAIRTERGSLYVYKKREERDRRGIFYQWYSGNWYPLVFFKMARNGNILGVTKEGFLVRNGQTDTKFSIVKALLASFSGRIVALLSNGEIVDQQESVYKNSWDMPQVLKIAANGVVVWNTQKGSVGSSVNPHLYSNFSDPVGSFKVNSFGRVAYLTQRGKLGRDTMMLYTDSSPVMNYKIYKMGEVKAYSFDGKEHWFSPGFSPGFSSGFSSGN